MTHDTFSQLPQGARCTIDIRKGDILFRQNQPTSGLYQVISGCVTLQRTSENGETLTLHCAQSNGYFAEASVFSEVYHCDAICTQAGRVLKIAKDDIIEELRTNPAFSEGFAKLLAVQVQHYRAQIEILAIRSAKDRVLAALQAGYLDATVTEFATRINLSHEACYRALRVLCDNGSIVQVGRGQYRIR